MVGERRGEEREEGRREKREGERRGQERGQKREENSRNGKGRKGVKGKVRRMEIQYEIPELMERTVIMY